MVKNVEQTAERQKCIEQRVQHEYHKTAERLRGKHEELQKAKSTDIKSYGLLPPISKAATKDGATMDPNFEGYGLIYSEEMSSYCCAVSGHPLTKLGKPKVQQPSTMAASICLPPMKVKRRSKKKKMI